MQSSQADGERIFNSLESTTRLESLDLSENLNWFDSDDKTVIELLKALIMRQEDLKALDLTGNGVSSYIHFWKIVPNSGRSSFNHGHRRASLGPYEIPQMV